MPSILVKNKIVYIGANSGTLESGDDGLGEPEGAPADGGDGNGDDAEMTPTEPEDSEERVVFFQRSFVLYCSFGMNHKRILSPIKIQPLTPSDYRRSIWNPLKQLTQAGWVSISFA